MLTHWLWKTFTDDFTIYTTTLEKISTYAILSFLSLIFILLDILTCAFQAAGVLIYVITNKSPRGKKGVRIMLDDKIEEVELQEDDIYIRTETDIHVNCPRCKHVYDEYDIDFETDYICECEHCGHKFKFNYCPY